MRATLLFCVVLCFGTGCDETEDTPVEKPSATFEIIEDGAGEPNEKALWPITVGTYFEREYVVESKNGESYRVNILTEAFAPLSIETWRRNDKGLEIVGSTATEISDARLAVPDEVRDGMKWKSASIEFSVKDEGMVDVGAFGTQRAWTIKASGIPKRYIEGIGPISEGVPNGVLVENDTNGPKLPKLQKPTPIEVDDDDSFINVRGIGTVDAVDVKNQKFMAVQNASNLPFGATNPRPQEQDSCFFVEGNNATIVELIEQRTIEMPAVAKGPHINRCAARQDAELGFVKHRGRVKDTFLFDAGITWTDVGPYGHHFRDGKAYAFLNPGIWAGGTELFEFQEDASFDIDTGIETDDRWGQVASANSVPLQHSGKRVHLFQQIQDWVRIAGIEDGKQLPPGPSWY